MSKSRGKLKKGVSIPSDASVSITCPCYLACCCCCCCCCCRRRTGGFRGAAEGASSCWGPPDRLPRPTAGTAAAEEPCETAPRHNHSFGCGFPLPRRHRAGEALAAAGDATQLRRFCSSIPRSRRERHAAPLLFSQRLDPNAPPQNAVKRLFSSKIACRGQKGKTEEVANHPLARLPRALKPNAPAAWLEIRGKGKARDKQPRLSLAIKGREEQAERIAPLLAAGREMHRDSERCIKTAAAQAPPPTRAQATTPPEAFKKCETRLPDLSAAIPRGRR